MEKKITKRSWLVGWLVGLVLLVGAAPAIAGYYYMGTYEKVSGDTYNYYGDWNGTSYDTTVPGNPTYFTLSGDVLALGGGTPLNFLTKFEPSSEGSPITSSQTVGGITYTVAGTTTSGTWTTSTAIVDYAYVKAGNYINLYGTDASGRTLGSTWDTYWDASKSGAQKDISHISFYSANQVPIPGAVWLLGSGLLGLIGVLRKRNVNNGKTGTDPGFLYPHFDCPLKGSVIFSPSLFVFPDSHKVPSPQLRYCQFCYQ